MSSWTGKHVLVTGGAAGIGLAFGRKCLENGAAKLAVLDIKDDEDVAAVLSNEFPDTEVVFLYTDVTDRESVRQSFGEARSLFGFIDVVLGNAGILDESQPERTILVNLLGIVHSTYAAIDFMSITSGGRGGLIVNMSSTAGLEPVAFGPAYSASKHGIVGLTRSFVYESYYKHHGIKFVTICPCFTQTAFLINAKPRQVEFTLDEMELLQSQKMVQTCEQVIDEIMKVLEDPKHGSIYMIEGGQTTELDIKHFTTNV